MQNKHLKIHRQEEKKKNYITKKVKKNQPQIHR